jgi:hypothetical protein
MQPVVTAFPAAPAAAAFRRSAEAVAGWPAERGRTGRRRRAFLQRLFAGMPEPLSTEAISA